MAIKAVVFQDFRGNWSADPKMGTKGSARYVQGFDVRSSPSQMTMSGTMERADGSILKDFIRDLVKVGTNTYAYGDTGYVYRYNGTTFTVVGQLPTSGLGLDYRQDTDSIYLTGTTTVHAYAPVSNAPTLRPSVYGPSLSTYNNSTLAGFNVSAAQSGSTQVTTVPTAIVENQTNLRYFQTDIEPLYSVSVFIPTKGSGNWTVTLHDGLNNTLATSTVANANINPADWNEFVFTTQVRVYPAPNARTYHIHVTSTVADGTISSSTAGDESTCDLRVSADRLVNTTYHPMIRFQQYEVFGNANYVSIWEPISDIPTNAEWQRHRLVFPSQYTVTGFALQGEFLVVGLSDGNAGFLAYWDGLSPTYNFTVSTPEGPPQSLNYYRNTVTYFAGGSWWTLPAVASNPIKLRTLPGQTPTTGAFDTVPYHGSTVFNGINLIGYNAGNTNTGAKTGIYSYGSLDKNFPETFGLEYAPSQTNTGFDNLTGFSVGMVKSPSTTDLWMSWKTATDFGIDKLNYNGSAPFAEWQSLIIDGGYTIRQQQGLYVDAYYYLPPGATMTLRYRLDRAATFVESEKFTTTNLWQGQVGYARLNLFDDGTDQASRYHEAEVAVEITNTAGNTLKPQVYCVSWVFDDLATESLG